MFYKAKVAVCSEIHTKHINAMWAECRICEWQTWSYVKLPLGLKRLKKCHGARLCGKQLRNITMNPVVVGYSYVE
jgi:hypothetical protein